MFRRLAKSSAASPGATLTVEFVTGAFPSPDAAIDNVPSGADDEESVRIIVATSGAAMTGAYSSASVGVPASSFRKNRSLPS